jgi:hypothetical protein
LYNYFIGLITKNKPGGIQMDDETRAALAEIKKELVKINAKLDRLVSKKELAREETLDDIERREKELLDINSAGLGVS